MHLSISAHLVAFGCWLAASWAMADPPRFKTHRVGTFRSVTGKWGGPVWFKNLRR